MLIRIADQRMIRLIQKWLKAGVSEEGHWSETKAGDSAGSGDPAVAGEHLSALRTRSMGNGVAQEECVRRYDYRPIRGRLCAWVSTPEGGRAVFGATAEAAGGIRIGTALGQDTPDTVRAVRGGRPEAGREGET